MSKLATIYFAKKCLNPDLVYIFHCGIFYLFLEDDAMRMNEMFQLKITHLSPEISKCGFSESASQKYFTMLDQAHVSYEVIELEKKDTVEKRIVKRLKEVNLYQVTPIEALEILFELKEMLLDEQ